MDSLTQIVLGAAVGEVVLGKKIGNRAMLWGAIAGTIPDLDVYMSLFFDPLRSNELHRAFSHSILFSVILAPLLAWILVRKEKLLLISCLALILGYPFVVNDNLVVRLILAGIFLSLSAIINFVPIKTQAETKEWSWLFFWALFTHPILDCHTTWGTQLFWPLPHKIAFNNIFVVDFFYTLPFLICLVAAMFYHRNSKTRKALNWTGIALSSLYMVWSIGVKGYVHRVFTHNLQAQHLNYSRLTTVPTPFNTFLWSGTADLDTSYAVGLYSIFDSDEVIDFFEIPKQHHLLDSYANQDQIKRLKYLAKDWYVVRQQDSGFAFNDARFGPMYDGKTDPHYGFGYNLYWQDDEFIISQDEPPSEGLDDMMKALVERVKGE